jgi:hypothetical protein
MPRMSWPSWRRAHTVTRAAGEVKLMYGGGDAEREIGLHLFLIDFGG